jgi:hypothetical protein
MNATSAFKDSFRTRKLQDRLAQSVIAWTFAIVCVATPLTAKAGPLVYDFSFTTNRGSIAGGTVSGEILGLSNGSNLTPTEVILTSFPSSFNGLISGSTVTITSFQSTFFDITNNVITNFQLVGTFSATGGAGYFQIDELSNGTPGVLQVGGNYIIDDSSADVITSPSVPEPSSCDLFLAGLLGLGFVAIRKRGIAKL